MIVPEARIKRIEKYFDRELPKELKLNDQSNIEDVRFYVDSYISFLKHAKSLKLAELYIEKLNEVKNKLENTIQTHSKFL